MAEKLHATRQRPNSRVKDLPDMALLASIRAIEARTLRDAVERTFRHRAVHPVPRSLPEPPNTWREPYARMARRDRLPWQDLDDVLRAARRFVEPMLAGVSGTWSPEAWGWVMVSEERRDS